MTPPPPSAPGPLTGLRVIEWTDEKGAWAGKLLADMGADVITIEPPAGNLTRTYPPFVDDDPGPERSLWWWYYNTSKRSITLDLECGEGRDLFRRLVAGADAVVESQPPRGPAALGIDYTDLRDANPRLIWVAITPFGRDMPRAEEEATDLTILAGGGPVWNCGYDDHALPPVRGGGNQGYHTGCHYAVMAFLVALVHRDVSGAGQFVDVNMHAAANVTTEAGSYQWLVARETVQRQTGRHAAVLPSTPGQVPAADGVHVLAGLSARRPAQFRLVYEWLEDEGLLDDFPYAPVLLDAAAGGEISVYEIHTNEEVALKFGAGREAMMTLAHHLPAHRFFTGAQERNMQAGIIYAPEEALEDPHIRARGFPVQVEHPELGRSITYPGAPYQFEKSPWRIRRRAPRLGEDNAAVYGDLGLSSEEIAALRARRVI